ncbi:MAG TPA: mechanosensitive ion channel family protein [Balneolales bacterium]|nr:mechanosensitive ion channel family protein [Balneolales bacterium]
MDIHKILTDEMIWRLAKVGLTLLISIPIILLLRGWMRRVVIHRYNAHYSMLAGKVLSYTLYIILIITVLHMLGVDMTPLLGAAGIVGIALGVASQTSVSNIISGFFMLAEQSFIVGDVITVSGVTGVVMSVDTLSVKLRTFDNRFVRIPNETIIKSEVVNATRFPIRRIDLAVSVAYKEDLTRVKKVLTELAAEDPLVLNEPESLIIFLGFNSSSIDLQFSFWTARRNYLNVKNGMFESVKRRFDQEGIEIPFPHVSLYSGEVTKPLPIELITPGPKSKSGRKDDHGKV